MRVNLEAIARVGKQGYSGGVAYDPFRSEDNRPRANPRPARDKLKRASVEPVSGTEKVLPVVGEGIWSMTNTFSFSPFSPFLRPAWQRRYTKSQLVQWHKGRNFSVSLERGVAICWHIPCHIAELRGFETCNLLITRSLS